MREHAHCPLFLWAFSDLSFEFTIQYLNSNYDSEYFLFNETAPTICFNMHMQPFIYQGPLLSHNPLQIHFDSALTTN